MSGAGCSREPVKVVIINTQYVETDATSFKSVVQKLTGKDSDNFASASRKAHRERHKHNVGRVEVPSVGGHGSSFSMKDAMYKEFDRFLSEMPPINDLWAE